MTMKEIIRQTLENVLPLVDLDSDFLFQELDSLGITTILIEGLESNDINHRGEFDFSVDKDTELLWKEAKIELSSLKEGQNVSITSTGEILESYPAQLTKVTKIIVLEDEL